MSHKKTKLIDTDSGLISVSLLHSFVKILKADAVILYKCIQEDDLEVTELLSLINNSPIMDKSAYENGKTFFSEKIIENFIKDYPKNGSKTSFQSLINDFKQGAKIDEKEHRDMFVELKQKIKVLRFCAIAENDPNHSRWNFDYKKRPPKYLLFDNSILKCPSKESLKKDDSDNIPNEGLTALFCRADGGYINALQKSSDLDEDKNINESKSNQAGNGNETNGEEAGGGVYSLIMNRTSIGKNKSHSKKQSDPNVYDNFSSHHAGWMILKDIEDKNTIVGCLRFEFYDSHKAAENIKIAKDKLPKMAIRPINDIIVADILQMLEKNKEHSYDRTYKCLKPLLNEIKQIGQEKRKITEDVKNTNKKSKIIAEYERLAKIHYQIEHLLYVLKRNTYFGDAAINRIKHFIKDLLENLSLPGSIFVDIWDQLRRHEDLMLYQIDKYRDHLVHQFHTFISGYIIIHRFGLDKFQELLNGNYNNFVSKDNYWEEECCFSKLDVIRVWAFTSLFHDCGYAFEKMPQGLKIFSEKVSGIKLKSKFFWDDFIFNNEVVPRIIQELSTYYVIPGNNKRGSSCKFKESHQGLTGTYLFRTLIQQMINSNDHGVLSATILMKQYYEYNKGYPKVVRIDPIIKIASIAIAMHNKPVFEKISLKDNSKICFSLNPIVFLLAYCDITQEWGRINREDEFLSQKDLDGYVSPKLHKIQSEDDPFCNSCKKIQIELHYPAKEKGKHLDREKIEELLFSAMNSFVSPQKEISFEIAYKLKGGKVFSKRFDTCNYCAGDSS